MSEPNDPTGPISPEMAAWFKAIGTFLSTSGVALASNAPVPHRAAMANALAGAGQALEGMAASFEQPGGPNPYDPNYEPGLTDAQWDIIGRTVSAFVAGALVAEALPMATLLAALAPMAQAIGAFCAALVAPEIAAAIALAVLAGLVIYGASEIGGMAYDLIDDLSDMLRDIFSDPLVLDLDGDGIELVALASSATLFDLDGDGDLERTGWVSPHDGLLVQDANRNGQVDGVAELFGDAHVDGYDELELIDSNSDGRIDALDPAWADLLIWRDLDADGIATPDELQTLTQAGIARLNLAYDQVDEELAGNIIARTGSYLRTDGATRDMASARFALDQSSGRPVIPENAELGNLLILPNLPASAALPDLRTAMYFDPVLKAMVEELVYDAHDFDTFVDFAGGGPDLDQVGGSIESRFLEILYRWTGVDVSGPPDPGDPYHVQVFEALTGMSLEPTTLLQREDLDNLWPQLVRQLGLQFLVQAAINPRLEPFHDLARDIAALEPDYVDEFEILAGWTAAAIAEAEAIAPAYSYLDYFAGLTLDPATGALAGDFDAFVAAFIAGEPKFSTTYVGGVGTSGSGPTLRLGSGGGVSTGDRHPWTEWYEDHGALVFHVADAMGLGEDYVLNLTGWRWMAGEATRLDGTDGNDLIDQAVTYTQRVTLVPGWITVVTSVPVETRDQLMFGYEGDDELRGNDGLDRLVGGTGNDLLKGGTGSDMYVYAEGDGLDRIVEQAGTDDTIYFSSSMPAISRWPASPARTTCSSISAIPRPGSSFPASSARPPPRSSTSISSPRPASTPATSPLFISPS